MQRVSCVGDDVGHVPNRARLFSFPSQGADVADPSTEREARQDQGLFDSFYEWILLPNGIKVVVLQTKYRIEYECTVR